MSLSRFLFTDRARPIVELGLGDSRLPSGQAVWDRARWDAPASRWAGNQPVWSDVSCDVVSVDINAGRPRVTDRFIVGTATLVVDNSSGWADPTQGPTDVLALRPGRTMRVGIEHAVYGRVWLFSGVLDRLVPEYVAASPDEAQMVAVDFLGEVNRAKLAGQGAAIPQEDASTRIARILLAVPFVSSRVRRDASSVALRGGDDTDVLDGQVADLLHIAADSAGGSVFGNVDGTVTFRARDWQTYTPGTPPDGTIGNVDPDDVCPVSWVRPFDRADIATRVIAGRRDPPSTTTPSLPIVVDDVDAQVRYGVEPFERRDLLTAFDPDLTSLADRWIVTRGERTAPRVSSVTLDARTADAALDLMTTASPFVPSRYRCRLRYPRGDVFDRLHYVTGYRHSISARSWSVELSLDIADTFEASGGRWDGARWDRATWTASPP